MYTYVQTLGGPNIGRGCTLSLYPDLVDQTGLSLLLCACYSGKAVCGAGRHLSSIPARPHFVDAVVDKGNAECVCNVNTAEGQENNTGLIVRLSLLCVLMDLPFNVAILCIEIPHTFNF